ncbi:glycosyltransferase family 2 protein [Paracoccus sediminicola]|uniref:glycosyltransferase family 2 protein n=1 Tax=Paracoccus sediminicola TaxID=3017783 RepID=UPI0022F12D0F|nr:glycosyltransferase family 2 protein [Paracoccus sediminicola]WBU57849.1 glycosyltransferase family 2 protein [Paracoccus sediminicola]
MPKISIIVTAYNIENYIRQSLDDVTSQTIEDIEIIVVDDGSTDATPDIIREYAEKDDRIKPILFDTNTIGGVASAANAGMDAATGDFIGFADGDDLYDPAMFEKLYQAAVDANADLSMCRYTLLDASTGEEAAPAERDRWAPYPTPTAFDLTEENRSEMLRFISVPWRKLYRRDLVERIELRYPVGDFFFEDNPFHWAAVIGANRIALVPEALCKHRVARVGQTMSTVDEKLLRIFYHHDIIRDWLIAQSELSTYQQDLLGWLAAQLSWVSTRTTGEMQQLLYDRLVPIMAHYDANDIAELESRNGTGRTAQMLRALLAQDFEAFSTAAGWADTSLGAAPATIGARHHSSSVLGRGMFHLRNSGPKETAKMTGRYVSDRLGLSEVIRNARRKNAATEVLDHADLMTAMVVLQRDLRALRSEVADLREKLDRQNENG